MSAMHILVSGSASYHVMAPIRGHTESTPPKLPIPSPAVDLRRTAR